MFRNYWIYFSSLLFIYYFHILHFSEAKIETHILALRKLNTTYIRYKMYKENCKIFDMLVLYISAFIIFKHLINVTELDL